MVNAEQGALAQKPTVLFLHGFLGSGEDWRVVRDGLAPEVACRCPDLPGHGRGPVVGEVGISTMAEGARWLLKGTDLPSTGRCVLAGYSMGGRLALLTALLHPERFSGLVLESVSPGLKHEEERDARLRHDEALANRLAACSGARWRFSDFLRDWYDQPLFASLHEHGGLVEKLVQSRLAHGHPADLAAALRAFSTGKQPSLWEAISQHGIPTLLIVGERDRKYRMIAEEMVERCPAMAMQVFAGCGHNVHLENPDGYTTALRSFVCANH